MKQFLFFILSLLSISTTAQEFIINTKASQATWTGYGEVGGFKQEGSIELESGKIIFTKEEITGGFIEFSARSISHENIDLQNHLRAKDFFNVKKHPTMRFDIKEIIGNTVSGMLTIRGISHNESFEFTGTKSTGSFSVIGKAIIDRTKYDIKYNSSSYFQDLGNYAIKNEFDLTFRLMFLQEKENYNK